MRQQQSKRHNVVLVKSPRPDQTVRLQYGQDLKVSFDPPSTNGCGTNYTWAVHVDSNYIEIASDTIVEGSEGKSREIVFRQKCTQKEWQELSHVFLGNIRAYLTDDPIIDPSYASIEKYSLIYVYLDCNNSKRNNIVTVIQPIPHGEKEHPQTVKVEPHQFLEVIYTQPSFAKLNWQTYVFPSSDSIAKLKSVYKESLAPNEQVGNYPTPNNAFHSSRKIQPESASCFLNTEHHQFFIFSDNNITELSAGVYPSCTINFLGHDFKNKHCNQFALKVNLAIRNKSKQKLDQLKDQSRPAATHVNHAERSLMIDERKLINPNKTEQIELIGSQDEFEIIISQPSVYFSRQASKLTSAVWRATVGSQLVKDRFSKHLCVSAMPVKWINDVMYQRFSVKVESATDIKGEVILGNISLACDALDNIVPENKRVISIIYKGSETENSTISHAANIARITGKSSNLHQNLKSAATNSGKTTYNVYSIPKGPKPPAKKFIFHVELSDFGSDLIHNEKWEFLNGAGKNNNTTERYLEFDPSSYPKKKDKANGNKNDQIENADDKKNSNANGKTWKNTSQSEERKSNTDNQAIKVQDVFSPKTNSSFTLKKGESLIFHLPLPIGNYGNSGIRQQWTPNVINVFAQNGILIWIQRNEIAVPTNPGTGIVHQIIEVRIVSNYRYPPEGLVYAGSLRLVAGKETIYIKLSLDATGNSPVPENYWADYYSSLNHSKSVEFGEFYQSETLPDNKLTLVNPIGKCFDVPVGEERDIEIIINKLDDETNPWTINGKMMSGDISCLDHSIYPLWDGSRVLRSLFRVKRNANNIFGEIKIQHNGEDTNTRIRPYGIENNKTSKPLPPISQPFRMVGSNKYSNKIRFENWVTDQHITIFPHDYVYIQVPDVADYLEPRLKHLGRKTEWKVELIESLIEPEVMNKLPTKIKSEIEALVPFYGHYGLAACSEIPYEGMDYVLPPLETCQPFIYDVIDALQAVYGKETKSFTVAELVFSYKIDNKFSVVQRLYLDVGECEYKDDKMPQPLLVDGSQDKQIKVKKGQTVVFNLKREIEVDTKSGGIKTLFVPWVCKDRPEWLLAESHETKASKYIEEFTFLVKEGAKSGKVIFNCSDSKTRTFELLCTE